MKPITDILREYRNGRLAEHVRQAVFKQIVGMVGERTGCPVVYGKL